MGTNESEAGQGEAAAEVQALAARWPRELIQAGLGEGLAARWVASRRAAERVGGAPWAGGPLTPMLAMALFEARRARRIVRGLEDAEAALIAQALGVRIAEGSSSPGAADRISRLLVVSSDGSDRFFKKINSLYRIYGKVLEVYVCACDEGILGEAVFGSGRRARALLVDHKAAVRQVLQAIAESASGDA